MYSAKATSAQQEKERRFFKAAEGLFRKYGYRKTSISEICRIAGYSKPTFYALFKDKSELFVKLIIDIAEKDVLNWQESLVPDLSPVEKLRSFFEFYEKVLAGKPIYMAILEDQSIMEQFAWIIYSTPHSPILSSLLKILEDGIAAGQFRKCNPDTALWMIYALLDSMYLLVPMLTHQKGAGENPAIAGEVKRFILRGLGYNDEE